jgi:hypothetical protein
MSNVTPEPPAKLGDAVAWAIRFHVPTPCLDHKVLDRIAFLVRVDL